MMVTRKLKVMCQDGGPLVVDMTLQPLHNVLNIAIAKTCSQIVAPTNGLKLKNYAI